MFGPLIPFFSATGLSILWLIVFALSVTSGTDWPGMGNLSPIGLAAVVSAAVLPMALIWAVTAVVSRTLSAAQPGRPTRLRRGHDDSESLARTVIMMQEQARRRAFLDSADLGLRDLCAHLGQIMDRLNIIDPAEMETQWALTSAGYPWAIPNTFLFCAEKSGPGFSDRLAERLAEDGPSAAALQRFLRRHALIEELCRDNTEDRLLRAILEDGPLERVALMLEDVDARMRALLGDSSPARSGLLSSAQTKDEPAGEDDFNAAMIDPLEDLETMEDFGGGVDWGREIETTTPTRRPPAQRTDRTANPPRGSLAERLNRPEPPPAGGRGAPEPKESAEDIARRLPYPPLNGSDMASIQERVARSLSRSALGQSPAGQGRNLGPAAQGKGHGKGSEGSKTQTATRADQFDVFGEDDDSLEDVEGYQASLHDDGPPTSRGA
ncbi:MAG: hypothetical protein K9H25_02510 [Rhodospirillum sp.]|nr:hypothetical protein [Rhodospirillum sp.]MCF8488002.1 hypothetical protein [Rhodospirillum sp.]MCF8500473.1 hypothetical protein [Rhodospirillum sp.]